MDRDPPYECIRSTTRPNDARHRLDFLRGEDGTNRAVSCPRVIEIASTSVVIAEDLPGLVGALAAHPAHNLDVDKEGATVVVDRLCSGGVSLGITRVGADRSRPVEARVGWPMVSFAI